MIQLGPMAYGAIALSVSLGLNVFLGWQWAEAKQECRADMERAAGIAIEAERDRVNKADKQASNIAEKASKTVRGETKEAEKSTDEREVEIRTVVVTGTCSFPDKLPKLQPAVDAANAAAGN